MSCGLRNINIFIQFHIFRSKIEGQLTHKLFRGLFPCYFMTYKADIILEVDSKCLHFTYFHCNYKG